ncbi:MAG: alcohol dehydrogenase catalytic domain-containing protein [Saprospiraceae bacterium]|nr:alcohol dehydrogenase catalytic domain-containing protein [Saprospiraceae bacterium]
MLEYPLRVTIESCLGYWRATVNGTDCAILWGKPWIMRYFTVLWKLTCKITGTDFAGRIEAVGRHVSIWRIGDRVWGFKGFGLQSHAQ